MAKYQCPGCKATQEAEQPPTCTKCNQQMKPQEGQAEQQEGDGNQCDGAVPGDQHGGAGDPAIGCDRDAGGRGVGGCDRDLSADLVRQWVRDDYGDLRGLLSVAPETVSIDRAIGAGPGDDEERGTGGR